MAPQRSPRDIISYMEREKVDMIDLRFSDLFGRLRHFSIPARELDENVFETGLVFDASVLGARTESGGSYLAAVPVPETAFTDPFLSARTLSMLCELKDPGNRQPYGREPRAVAARACRLLASSGIGDTALFSPGPEFFIFDEIRFDQKENSGFYSIDSVEGRWNTGRPENPNLGYKPRFRDDAFPCPPSDTLQDIRSEIILILERIGILTESHHHDSSTGGKCGFLLNYAPLMETADNIMKFKYIVKNAARKFNKTATFMPKPLFNERGSGMSLQISLWKDTMNVFSGDTYNGLSNTALWAAGGILRHTPALLAFACPTTNSYKRLLHGEDGPTLTAYSSGAGNTAVRVPLHTGSERSHRIEFRCPDPTCNPYLTFAAVIMAVIDGISHKTDPGRAFETFTNGSGAERPPLPAIPSHLGESLTALANDHDFLTAGGVFSEELIRTWIGEKRENEVRVLEERPHPAEYSLYYDA